MTLWASLYNQASAEGKTHEYCKKYASSVLKFRTHTLKLKAQRKHIKMMGEKERPPIPTTGKSKGKK
jgi:hypothetical protein